MTLQSSPTNHRSRRTLLVPAVLATVFIVRMPKTSGNDLLLLDDAATFPQTSAEEGDIIAASQTEWNANTNCRRDNAKGIIAGALRDQPGPVFCTNLVTGGVNSSTVVTRSSNSWLDTFDHGLSFASFEGINYRTADGLQDSDSVHWRHADHWMVDLTSQPLSEVLHL